MNPVQILSATIIEYPKSPARGDLIRVIKRSRYDHRASNDLRPDNICACLLGRVIVAGGVPLDRVDYCELSDGNGIEESVKFLWEAIKGVPLPSSATASAIYGDVYRFNDSTLEAGEARTYEEDGTIVFTYSPEVVAKVVAKVQEALELAKKAAAREALDTASAAIEAAKEALA